MYLGARLLGVLRGDEDPGPEPLPGGEEGHDQHLGRHDPRVEGVRLEQLLVHLHAHGVCADGKLCVQGLSVCNCPSLLLLATTATCFQASTCTGRALAALGAIARGERVRLLWRVTEHRDNTDNTWAHTIIV